MTIIFSSISGLYIWHSYLNYKQHIYNKNKQCCFLCNFYLVNGASSTNSGATVSPSGYQIKTEQLQTPEYRFLGLVSA